LRLSLASAAAACLIGAGCGGGDLVLPENPAPAPASAEAFDGSGQSASPGAELADPIVVKVRDAEGAPVPDVRVAFELGAGAEGGEVTPDTATTDAAGEASASWVLGPGLGEHQVDAEVVGAGLDVVSFTATAVEDLPEPSGELSSLTATPASIEAITGVASITVTVRDQSGEPVAGATVTLFASGASNFLTQPSTPTGEDGVAEGALQALTPGTRVVSAMVNGDVAIVETATVEVVTTPPPPTNRLVFLVQPTDAEEDQIISPPVSVAVVDGEDNVVPLSGVEIRLELVRDDHDSNELEGDTTQLTEVGIAVFPDLRVDRDERGYRLRATAPERPELGSVESETFDVED
jgi:Invasin, domain 3